jgi:CRISPR/Cas system-associated exonuclease Cas4 (RecB family)
MIFLKKNWSDQEAFMDPLERFEFSQSSLQDFVDCPRRFQLRYLQRVTWPAIQAEPARENERRMQRGERFHRMVQQYLLGVPEGKLSQMAAADEDENLKRWWQNFLDWAPRNLNGTRNVETTLVSSLDRFRLTAIYDLVLIRADGMATIFDWKTSPKRPTRARLLERLQTRIYPYLLASAGRMLNNGSSFQPEQIDMIYWFAEPDQAPERLAYSGEQYAEDGQYLLALVNQIQSFTTQDYKMADSGQPCGFCVYRSLCSRGERAGDLASGLDDNLEPDDTRDLDFNLEQIGEISF